jgi:C4-dicarboxylate transporter
MFQFFLITGIVCIIISGIFVGAWVDGDRQRANFHTETSEDRSVRTKVALIFALVGLIALIISVIIYLIVGY